MQILNRIKMNEHSWKTVYLSSGKKERRINEHKLIVIKQKQNNEWDLGDAIQYWLRRQGADTIKIIFA